MTSIVSVQSAERECGIDLPVWDVATVLAIFGEAWRSNDLWETSRVPQPVPCRVIRRRLDLLGYTEMHVLSDFMRLHENWVHVLKQRDETKMGAAQLSRLTPGDAWRELQAGGGEVDQIAPSLIQHLVDAEDNEEFPQDGTIIRLALSTFGDDERVLAEISQQALFDLTPGDVEWHEDEYPHSYSLARYRDQFAWRNTKPILLLVRQPPLAV